MIEVLSWNFFLSHNPNGPSRFWQLVENLNSMEGLPGGLQEAITHSWTCTTSLWLGSSTKRRDYRIKSLNSQFHWLICKWTFEPSFSGNSSERSNRPCVRATCSRCSNHCPWTSCFINMHIDRVNKAAQNTWPGDFVSFLIKFFYVNRWQPCFPEKGQLIGFKI